jgi:hypothetical protein
VDFDPKSPHRPTQEQISEALRAGYCWLKSINEKCDPCRTLMRPKGLLAELAYEHEPLPIYQVRELDSEFLRRFSE